MPETYNLPGYGLIRYDLFPHAQMVYQHAASAGLISRLERTNQLGALREILPGAHHTRFEYVMAQLAMITELCYLRGPQPAGFSMGSERSTFGRLPGFAKDPTNGEILQIITLLTNLGHVHSTFSGERAFVHHLRKYRSARRAFRSGLDRPDWKYFDDVIENFRIYNISNLIALFLLNRYKRRANGVEIAEFCHQIMRSYINAKHETDPGLIALWQLFRSIRRLTYLALDSLYTPVPFSLDLASIFLSLEHYLEEVFAFESGFQDALSRIEGVMRDSVYLSGPALIQHSSASSYALDMLERHNAETTSIAGWLGLLGATDKSEMVFGWARTAGQGSRAHHVVLAYSVDPALSGDVLNDTVEWERRVERLVGSRNCSCGAEWDPLRSNLRVAAAVRSTASATDQAVAALRIGKQLAYLESSVDEHARRGPQERWSNGRAILLFLLRGVFGWKHLYRLSALPAAEESPVFIGRGTTHLSKKLTSYIDRHEDAPGLRPDRLHDLRMMAETLEQIPYTGLTLAYAGSSEVVSRDRVLAEFDGVIFLLGAQSALGSVIIVEGKNMPHGHTEAKSQLRLRLGGLGIDPARYTLHDLGTKGAYAGVSISP